MSPRRLWRGLVRRAGYVWGPRLASALRKRWILLRHPHADIRFRGAVHIGPGFSLHMPEGGKLIVGHGVEFRRNFRAELASPEATLEIGDLTAFTYESLIQVSTSIRIGARCVIGRTVIVDGNHRFRDSSRPMIEQGYDYRPIEIGDDVGITSMTTVIASIGDHGWIGAGSVVTRDIPAYSLAVGAPARVIESFAPAGEGAETSSGA